MTNSDWRYQNRNPQQLLSEQLTVKPTSRAIAMARRPLLSLPFVTLMATISGLAHAELVQGADAKSDYPTESNAPSSMVVINTDQVLQCAQVDIDSARLACFDKVAKGNSANVGASKAPLDLAKTLTTSIQEGKAVAVLAEKPETGLPDNVDENDKAILSEVGVTKGDVKRYSQLSMLYDLDENDPRGVFMLRPHRATYVMPVWYSATPNRDIHSPTRSHVTYSHDELQNLDSKMQISLKSKLMEDVFGTNADVWFGYTQQSYWQVFNRHSRPFRSTDYQPEVMITQPITAALPFGGDLRVLGAGIVHQSNGQDDPLSRSWNRAYVMAGMEWGNLSLISRLWAIGDTENTNNNDNPDIGDYMGYGDMRWLYDMGGQRAVGGLLRYNPATEKGAISVDYTHPITGGMKAYIQLFHGYGENIQDYNHKSTNVGIGLTFNDFRGL